MIVHSFPSILIQAGHGALGYQDGCFLSPRLLQKQVGFGMSNLKTIFEEMS